MEYNETIASELEPLLPKFFVNARNDLETLRKALAEGRLIDVQRIGHSLKGAGLGYGFVGLGEIGKAIETEAATKNTPEVLTQLFSRLEDYLDSVRVTLQDEN